MIEQSVKITKKAQLVSTILFLTYSVYSCFEIISKLSFKKFLKKHP